jgi:Flp pilus assembly protein TadB
MRKHQIVPLALLVVFAAVLFLAVAAVQMERKAAIQEYVDAEAKFKTQRETVVDIFFFEDFNEANFDVRMRFIDEAQDQAIAKQQAALDRAYTWNCWISAAGVVMFFVFVGVTIYTGRKAADDAA